MAPILPSHRLSSSCPRSLIGCLGNRMCYRAVINSPLCSYANYLLYFGFFDGEFINVSKSTTRDVSPGVKVEIRSNLCSVTVHSLTQIAVLLIYVPLSLTHERSSDCLFSIIVQYPTTISPVVTDRRGIITPDHSLQLHLLVLLCSLWFIVWWRV